MFNSFFNGGNIIIGACSFLVDSSLALEVLDLDPADFPSLIHPDVGVILLDADERFIVIDVVRETVVSEFQIDHVRAPEQITDFCGSLKNCGELAVLTDRRLLIVRVNLDHGEVLAELDIASNCLSPFQHGYLLNCSGGLFFYADGGLDLFHRTHGGSEFRVSGESVVIATVTRDTKRGTTRRVKVVGGRAFGLKNFTTELWDVTAGYLVALSGHALSFTNIHEAQAPRAVVSMSKVIDRPLKLFAALDCDDARICVIVIGPHDSLTVHVPLAVLRYGPSAPAT
jgi:hypothetical protein